MTTTGMTTVIHPVQDLDAAKKVYAALLGVGPVMDEPYYVQFEAPGGLQVGLDPNGHKKGMTGPVNHWYVDDIQATIDTLVGTGAQTTNGPSDVGGGRLVATLSDADGNPIGLIQDPR